MRTIIERVIILELLVDTPLKMHLSDGICNFSNGMPIMNLAGCTYVVVSAASAANSRVLIDKLLFLSLMFPLARLNSCKIYALLLRAERLLCGYVCPAIIIE